MCCLDSGLILLWNYFRLVQKSKSDIAWVCDSLIGSTLMMMSWCRAVQRKIFNWWNTVRQFFCPDFFTGGGAGCQIPQSCFPAISELYVSKNCHRKIANRYIEQSVEIVQFHYNEWLISLESERWFILSQILGIFDGNEICVQIFSWSRTGHTCAVQGLQNACAWLLISMFESISHWLLLRLLEAKQNYYKWW